MAISSDPALNWTRARHVALRIVDAGLPPQRYGARPWPLRWLVQIGHVAVVDEAYSTTKSGRALLGAWDALHP